MTSQYRCGTCKRRKTLTCPLQDEKIYYKIKEYVPVPTGWEVLTSVTGCKLHSDFQSEREEWQRASLQDGEKFIRQAERDCPVCGGKLMCHCWCIDSDCGWDSTKQSKQDKEDWIRKKFFEWISTKIQSPSIYACEQKWEELREGKDGE